MANPPINPVIEQRSERFSRVVNRLFTRQLKKSFFAVHLLDQPVAVSPDKALVCCSNHPSWNDPMVLHLLHYLYFPEREAYGPIDAEALEGYGFMKKIGIYGVTHGNPGGARKFLRDSLAILERTRTAIWITAQGQFRDARERPAQIEPGLGALLSRADMPVELLPVALEYAYGEEKLPEVYVNFGQPVTLTGESSAKAWKAACEKALEQTQDRLAEKVIARDFAAFTTILGGKAGVGGIYQFWQRLRAVIRGETYDPRHGSLTTRK